MRGSNANGPGAGATSCNGPGGQGPAAINEYTGTRLQEHWWWLV